MDLRPSANLLGVTDDNLGTALIKRDVAADFDFVRGQCLKVSEFIAIGLKDDACEWAATVVRAEIKEIVPGTRSVNAHNSAADATEFPHMRTRVAEVHTAACGL
jgi:hypothetical protein